MALEKSATSRSTPTATRPTSAPSSSKSQSVGTSSSGRSEPASPSFAPDTNRDEARSSRLEPEDRVTLSEPGDDFDPNAMRNLDRSLRAGQYTSKPESDETESARETDSILDPRSENFDDEMAAFAEQSSAEARQRLEEGNYKFEGARQSDLLEAERSVEDYADARDYIDSVAPRPLDSYVPENFVGTEEERTQAALSARREEGIEIMDEVLADPDLTVRERNAALLSVQRHFEYNAMRSRQLDPVTLETVHKGKFPEEIYGSEAKLDPRTTAIIEHDPNKGLSPYLITFDPTNKALNPEGHISSFLRNPARLGDIAWSELNIRDTISRAWQSLVG